MIGGTGSANPLTASNLIDSVTGRATGGTTTVTGSVPGDTDTEMDWTFQVPKTRNYVVLYGDAYAEDDILPVQNPARNPWHPGIYITRFPGISKLDLHVEGVSTEAFGAISDTNHGDFNYWNAQYRDGPTNYGNVIGNTVGRDGQSIQTWLRYWISPTSTVSFSYKNNTVGSDFVPQGAAWQDYAVQGEIYKRNGFYMKAQVQFENISHYAILFAGPQKNVTAILEVGFSPAEERPKRIDTSFDQVAILRGNASLMSDHMPEQLTKSNGPEVATLELSPNGSDPYPETIFHSRTVDRLRLLWSRRRLLVQWTLAGLVLSLVIAICIPNQYESTVRLMPPDQISSSMAMLAATTTGGGNNSSGLGAIAGDLMGLKSSSALFVEILQGRTVQDDVVNEFGLRKVYSDRYMEDARGDLRMNTTVLEDRRSGIITIKLTDKDPHRAAAMAGEYVEELDRVVTKVNTSSAQRERVFLEGRLVQVKQDLESAENNFSQFASKNTAIDIPAQGKAMIDAAATLEGELMASQTELESLKQVYADGNVRVRAMQARANEIQRQLEKLGGKPPDETTPSEVSNTPAAYPTIRSLPVLGMSYADLYRNTKVQEAIFETLTKEYELAKVQEAKETPSVKIVDPPNVAEKKSFPPRLQITLLGACVAAFFGVAWILAHAAWDQKDPRDPQKVLTMEVVRSVKGRLGWGSTNGFAVGAGKSGTSDVSHGQLDIFDKHQ